MDFKIDASDPNNLSNKILSEQETRRKLLTHARSIGCEKDILILFNKYDKLMRNCSNQKEREDIAKIGILSIYQALGAGGELYIDGQLVYKDK